MFAAAQSPLSPAIRRSKPAGAWRLSIRTGASPWLVKACGTPGGTSTNVPGVAGLEGELALEDVERVVLVGVHVRLEVPPRDDLDDAEREPRRVRGPGEELDVAVTGALAGR